MLPKIEHPSFRVKLPLSKKEVRYRAYLVGEEKRLLMAMETEDTNEKIDLLFGVLDSVTFNEVDWKKMPLADMVFLVTKIRSASKGEKLELVIKCNNTLSDGSVCQQRNDVDVDLNDIKVTGEPKNNIIKLSDTVGIQLQPPSTDILINLLRGEKMSVLTTSLFRSIIKSVFDEDEVYDISLVPDSELEDFIDNITETQMDEIQKYIESLPSAYVTTEFKCKSCGHIQTTRLDSEDLNRFLA